MKVFFTPAIDGQYREDAKVRMEDAPDWKIYDMFKDCGAQENIDDLDRDGSTKWKSIDITGKVTGYYTYIQDEL